MFLYSHHLLVRLSCGRGRGGSCYRNGRRKNRTGASGSVDRDDGHGSEDLKMSVLEHMFSSEKRESIAKWEGQSIQIVCSLWPVFSSFQGLQLSHVFRTHWQRRLRPAISAMSWVVLLCFLPCGNQKQRRARWFTLETKREDKRTAEALPPLAVAVALAFAVACNIADCEWSRGMR